MRARIAACLALVAASAAVPFVACGEPYTAPCTAGEELVLAQELDASAPVSTMTLDDDGADGVVVTIVRAEAPDPDASAQRVPGLPASVDVIALHADGTIARRQSVEAPEALRGRHGSTGPFGVENTGEGVLFHWVETITTTAPDGVLSTSAALRVAFVGFDGAKGRVLTPDGATCTACRLTPSVATAGGRTAFVIHVVPDGTSLATEGPPAVLALFDAMGALVSSAVRPDLGAGAGVAAENGLFFFFDGARLTITDPSLAVRGGPFVLPGSGAGSAVDWDPVARELEVAWTQATIEASTSVGEGADVLLQRFAADGTPLTRAERITTGGILEMRRRDGRIGTLVTTTGVLSFALADDTGKKIGGDVPIASRPTPHPIGATEVIGGPAVTHRLFAVGGGRYVDWSATTTRATRREIACDR